MGGGIAQARRRTGGCIEEGTGMNNLSKTLTLAVLALGARLAQVQSSPPGPAPAPPGPPEASGRPPASAQPAAPGQRAASGQRPPSGTGQKAAGVTDRLEL